MEQKEPEVQFTEISSENKHIHKMNMQKKTVVSLDGRTVRVF